MEVGRPKAWLRDKLARWIPFRRSVQIQGQAGISFSAAATGVVVAKGWDARASLREKVERLHADVEALRKELDQLRSEAKQGTSQRPMISVLWLSLVSSAADSLKGARPLRGRFDLAGQAGRRRGASPVPSQQSDCDQDLDGHGKIVVTARRHVATVRGPRFGRPRTGRYH